MLGFGRVVTRLLLGIIVFASVAGCIVIYLLISKKTTGILPGTPNHPHKTHCPTAKCQRQHSDGIACIVTNTTTTNIKLPQFSKDTYFYKLDEDKQDNYAKLKLSDFDITFDCLSATTERNITFENNFSDNFATIVIMFNSENSDSKTYRYGYAPTVCNFATKGCKLKCLYARIRNNINNSLLQPTFDSDIVDYTVVGKLADIIIDAVPSQQLLNVAVDRSTERIVILVTNTADGERSEYTIREDSGSGSSGSGSSGSGSSGSGQISNTCENELDNLCKNVKGVVGCNQCATTHMSQLKAAGCDDRSIVQYCNDSSITTIEIVLYTYSKSNWVYYKNITLKYNANTNIKLPNLADGEYIAIKTNFNVCRLTLTVGSTISTITNHPPTNITPVEKTIGNNNFYYQKVYADSSSIIDFYVLKDNDTCFDTLFESCSNQIYQSQSSCNSCVESISDKSKCETYSGKEAYSSFCKNQTPVPTIKFSQMIISIPANSTPHFEENTTVTMKNNTLKKTVDNTQTIANTRGIQILPINHPTIEQVYTSKTLKLNLLGLQNNNNPEMMRQTMMQYPPTMPAGNQTHSEESILYIKPQSTWKEYLNNLINNYPDQVVQTSTVTSGFLPTDFISVSSGNAKYTKQQTPLFVPRKDVLCTHGFPKDNRRILIVDSDITIGGLIVESGGIVFIHPNCGLLKTEFLLVESGGLFQAGCRNETLDAPFKATNPFKLMITHPSVDDTNNFRMVHSRYSERVYSPGAHCKTNCPKNGGSGTSNNDSDCQNMFDGSCGGYNNMFANKVIACGFNGTIHLASGPGRKHSTNPYYGTWHSSDGTENDNSDIMQTYLETEKPHYEYDMLSWCNVWDKQDGETEIIPIGANKVRILIPFRTDDDLTDLTDQTILLTFKRRQFQTRFNKQELFPINLQGLNFEDKEQIQAQNADNEIFNARLKYRVDNAAFGELERYFPVKNQQTIIKTDLQKSTGLEFLRIDNAVRVKDNSETERVKKLYNDRMMLVDLFLTDKTQFVHDCSFYQVEHTDVSKSNTTTRTIMSGIHVGFLKRDIIITSDLEFPKETKTEAMINTMVNKTAVSSQPLNQQHGTVVCNSNGIVAERANHDVTSFCMSDSETASADEGNKNEKFRLGIGDTQKNELCPDGLKGSVIDGKDLCGHWIFGTAVPNGSSNHKKGGHNIFGAHSLFKFGSSVSIDGCMLDRMGKPANFGSIARYALHFHLTGFPSQWLGYLPNYAIDPLYIYPHKITPNGKNIQAEDLLQISPDERKMYTRSANIANNSITRSFSRWCTLHGIHGASVVNNVMSICYGSGVFVEDGTEMDNNIEHNLCCASLRAAFNEYYNRPWSSPMLNTDIFNKMKTGIAIVAKNGYDDNQKALIMPNVGSDLQFMSLVWFKNNCNHLRHNVLCCTTAPVCSVWYVPQGIATLRGPSVSCVGDIALGLPALGSMSAAANPSPLTLMSDGRLQGAYKCRPANYDSNVALVAAANQWGPTMDSGGPLSCAMNKIAELDMHGLTTEAAFNMSFKDRLYDSNELESISGTFKPVLGYTPDYFFSHLAAATSYRSLAHSSTNDRNPYGTNTDNVCYQTQAAMWGLPELLAAASPGADGAIIEPHCDGTVDNRYNAGDEAFPIFVSPITMPVNGQNSCVDGFAQTAYMSPPWGEGLRQSPLNLPQNILLTHGLSSAAYTDSNVPEVKFGFQSLTYSSNLGVDAMPAVISGLLSYCVGSVGLTGASSWYKATPVHLFKSCILESSYRIDYKSPNDKGHGGFPVILKPHNGAGVIDSRGNGTFSMIMGVEGFGVAIPSAYNVLSDFTCNGAFQIPSGVSVMDGDIFIGDNCVVFGDGAEYASNYYLNNLDRNYIQTLTTDPNILNDSKIEHYFHQKNFSPATNKQDTTGNYYDAEVLNTQLLNAKKHVAASNFDASNLSFYMFTKKPPVEIFTPRILKNQIAQQKTFNADIIYNFAAWPYDANLVEMYHIPTSDTGSGDSTQWTGSVSPENDATVSVYAGTNYLYLTEKNTDPAIKNPAALTVCQNPDVPPYKTRCVVQPQQQNTKGIPQSQYGLKFPFMCEELTEGTTNSGENGAALRTVKNLIPKYGITKSTYDYIRGQNLKNYAFVTGATFLPERYIRSFLQNTSLDSITYDRVCNNLYWVPSNNVQRITKDEKNLPNPLYGPYTKIVDNPANSRKTPFQQLYSSLIDSTGSVKIGRPVPALPGDPGGGKVKPPNPATQTGCGNCGANLKRQGCTPTNGSGFFAPTSCSRFYDPATNTLSTKAKDLIQCSDISGSGGSGPMDSYARCCPCPIALATGGTEPMCVKGTEGFSTSEPAEKCNVGTKTCPKYAHPEQGGDFPQEFVLCTESKICPCPIVYTKTPVCSDSTSCVGQINSCRVGQTQYPCPAPPQEKGCCWPTLKVLSSKSTTITVPYTGTQYGFTTSNNTKEQSFLFTEAHPADPTKHFLILNSIIDNPPKTQTLTLDSTLPIPPQTEIAIVTAGSIDNVSTCQNLVPLYKGKGSLVFAKDLPINTSNYSFVMFNIFYTYMESVVFMQSPSNSGIYPHLNVLFGNSAYNEEFFAAKYNTETDNRQRDINLWFDPKVREDMNDGLNSSANRAEKDKFLLTMSHRFGNAFGAIPAECLMEYTNNVIRALNDYRYDSNPYTGRQVKTSKPNKLGTKETITPLMRLLMYAASSIPCMSRVPINSLSSDKEPPKCVPSDAAMHACRIKPEYNDSLVPYHGSDLFCSTIPTVAQPTNLGKGINILGERQPSINGKGSYYDLLSPMNQMNSPKDKNGFSYIIPFYSSIDDIMYDMPTLEKTLPLPVGATDDNNFNVISTIDLSYRLSKEQESCNSTSNKSQTLHIKDGTFDSIECKFIGPKGIDEDGNRIGNPHLVKWPTDEYFATPGHCYPAPTVFEECAKLSTQSNCEPASAAVIRPSCTPGTPMVGFSDGRLKTQGSLAYGRIPLDPPTCPNFGISQQIMGKCTWIGKRSVNQQNSNPSYANPFADGNEKVCADDFLELQEMLITMYKSVFNHSFPVLIPTTVSDPNTLMGMCRPISLGEDSTAGVDNTECTSQKFTKCFLPESQSSTNCPSACCKYYPSSTDRKSNAVGAVGITEICGEYTCLNNGICTDDICHCLNGYAGTNCGTVIVPIISNSSLLQAKPGIDPGIPALSANLARNPPDTPIQGWAVALLIIGVLVFVIIGIRFLKITDFGKKIKMKIPWSRIE